MYIHLNSLDQISLTFVLISSLVAAALGGFNSLPLAVVGGLAVGLIFSFGQGYIADRRASASCWCSSPCWRCWWSGRASRQLEVVAEF